MKNSDWDTIVVLARKVIARDVEIERLTKQLADINVIVTELMDAWFCDDNRALVMNGISEQAIRRFRPHLAHLINDDADPPAPSCRTCVNETGYCATTLGAHQCNNYKPKEKPAQVEDGNMGGGTAGLIRGYLEAGCSPGDVAMALARKDDETPAPKAGELVIDPSQSDHVHAVGGAELLAEVFDILETEGVNEEKPAPNVPVIDAARHAEPGDSDRCNAEDGKAGYPERHRFAGVYPDRVFIDEKEIWNQYNSTAHIVELEKELAETKAELEVVSEQRAKIQSAAIRDNKRLHEELSAARAKVAALDEIVLLVAGIDGWPNRDEQCRKFQRIIDRFVAGDTNKEA
jgi:hypothetical protein